MSYRSHIFSYYHLLRECGAGATKIYDVADVEDTADPGAPVSRLYDDQVNRLVTADGDGTRYWTCDTNSATTTPSHLPFLSRAIIPTPNSLRTEGIAFKVQYATTTSGWIDVESGGSVIYFGGSPEALVVAFDTEVSPRYIRCVFLDGYQASSRVQLGELYYTVAVTPTTGVVYSWEHPSAEDNADVTRMFSGDTFVTVRGPALRRFSVEHRAVTGADLVMYDDMFRSVGTHTPFWYEHNDSGTQSETLLAFSEAGTWTHTNATGAYATGRDGTANDARTVTSSASGFAAVRHSLTAAVDMRDAYLSFDVKLSAPAAIVTNDDMTVQLEYTGSAGRSEWAVGLPIIGSQLTDTWYRIFVDPREEPFAVTSTEGVAVNLQYVDRVRIGWQATASAQVMTLDNLLIWHRAAGPVRCRFTRAPERTQDSPVPSVVGPSYKIQMELVEVTG